MPTYNEITLAKELIRFPSITPIDAGVMKFLAKKLTAIGFKCKILEFKELLKKIILLAEELMT
jgi:succinyl-diaminopimelate desuccinylase